MNSLLAVKVVLLIFVLGDFISYKTEEEKLLLTLKEQKDITNK